MMLRKRKHNDICRNKYGHQGNPRAVRSPLSLRSQNKKFSGLENRRSGSHESIGLPSSSNVASASKVDQACAGLLQKEIQNPVHSASKSVRDDKSRSRARRRRWILAEDEVNDENCRCSSSKGIKDEKPERRLIKDQDEALPSFENAQDIAVKSKVQISAADEALNKLQNGSLDASKSQSAMQAETYDAEGNISGHKTFMDHQIYELVRPMIFCVWRLVIFWGADPYVALLNVFFLINSGSFEICDDTHGPIKAHLSNKACEKVCIAAAKLPPVLQMAKLSMLEVWPRSFKTSPPTGDNIALYFFPGSTRAKSMLGDLLCDVISKHLVLKVVFNEAELLIFPSIILPKVNHRFQGNYYLWGVFKGRQVPVHGVPSSCCSRANDLPEGEKKMQDFKHAEGEIGSHFEKSAVVPGNGKVSADEKRAVDSEPSGGKENVEAVSNGKVAEEDQRTDDSESSGEKENVGAQKSSDVFQNKKLKEEEQKVDGFNLTRRKDQVEAYDESSPNVTDDGNDNNLSNHLMTLEKKIPSTGTVVECPDDRRMGNWENAKEVKDYESTEKCLLLFPLQVEDMGIKSGSRGGTALDLDLGLGLSAGYGRAKGMSDRDSPANIFLGRDI
ncbi:hypothetical protein COCNU_15G001120 [Cocos nucifera]|uniref:AIPP2-like SPOC-like domain-containing protein n=1 Tax=Cocos nucifera TaxID=13894 RepID=A0A8K0ND49_COCNU|nr:hypothetical protein COCNU_15G001120 [Cocos nucifera]